MIQKGALDVLLSSLNSVEFNRFRFRLLVLSSKFGQLNCRDVFAMTNLFSLRYLFLDVLSWAVRKIGLWNINADISIIILKVEDLWQTQDVKHQILKPNNIWAFQSKTFTKHSARSYNGKIIRKIPKMWPLVKLNKTLCQVHLHNRIFNLLIWYCFD